MSNKTINGPGPAALSIDGNATSRVFNLSGGAIISGLTIKNGNASAAGGVSASGGVMTITGSTISGNSATFGAAIKIQSGTLTITDSTISENFNGGSVSDIEVSGTATMNLINSTISGNARAGVQAAHDATVTLINSTVSGNAGGGASGSGGSGGIINTSGGTLTLTNSTVSGNTAIGFGGGIFNATSGGSVDLLNSIIANNTGDDCSGSITSLGHNLDSDSTCSFNATGDLKSVDPKLGPLQDNGGPTETHALLTGSPAIDTGDDSVLGSPLFLTTDQRGAGFPRLQGTHVDIGAFEAAPAPNTPPVADPQTVNTTQDTPVLITLTGSDSDTGDILSFKITRLPNSGDLDDGAPLTAPRAIAGDTVTYAPNAGIIGVDSFEFIANDGTADSPVITIMVEVSSGGTFHATLQRMPSFQIQLDILSGDGVPPELAHSAIDQLPAMLMGTPVVLPTSGGQVSMETWMESIRFFDRASVDLEDAIKAITGVKMDNATDAGVRAHANQVSVLLEATLSVIRGIGRQVGGVDPAGTIPPHLRSDRQKIEGPFLPMAPMKFPNVPIERTEVCNIESGESSGGGTDAGGSFSEFSSACIITKESFGVKAVLFHRVISVYQEPWDVRESSIIGHEVVWYIRWMPAEHIKTIIYESDASGRVKMRIRQNDILMPGLSKFWSFYPQ